MDSNVEALLKKAGEAVEPHHAMHFAQAALNAAQALLVMKDVEK